MLGDIVISLETAIKQAAIFGHSLEREIGFLTVHSTLHLLGYDHELSSLDERIMREKEEHVLDELGISRDATFVSEGGDL
jgi:probable rRNA maturation factor